MNKLLFFILQIFFILQTPLVFSAALSSVCEPIFDESEEKRRQEMRFSDAISADDIKTVKRIFEIGVVDINSPIEYGQNPLGLASLLGQLNIVKFLASKGAQLNARDDYGNTAIMVAARYNQIEVTRFLASLGVDLEIQNVYGKTALIRAAKNNHTEIVDILTEAGANLNTKDSHGKTAYQHALDRDYIKTVESLVRAGALKKVTYLKKNGNN